ncbi:SdpI family protein [Hathewaya histolytica]|uniref:Immunity protein sdpI n=1 Tax=Hathewaya histolytica TaxID=1498 RepID=A0A4U9RRH9_HATHI|nr:SdpI family protein [Hathewaya histolytica]VTQ91540.1 Immunity protein sdpI [Hathewaya histolytica]
MKNKILWAVTLLPICMILVAIQFMEDKIPVHYDFMGNIDRWGSKYEKLIFPIIIIIVTLFWSLFLRYFRKRQVMTSDEKSIKEAQQNEKVIYYVAIGMAVLFGIMNCSSMYSSMVEVKNNMQTMAIDINVITNVVIGIFLIIIGNVIPKSKLNSVVGVRTKWSMKNDITWAKSNRFGGIFFMVSGLIIIIESVFIGGIASTIVMLGVIIIDGIISSIYSYTIYKKH